MSKFMKQWFLLLSLVPFSCFWAVKCAALQLHPDEAVVLRQIAAKMGARLMNTTEDPCQSLKLPLPTPPSTLQINLIACNRTIGNFSRITNIRLKYLSLPGTIPTELVNLHFLEEM
ncbi:hypothetical protein Pint_10273 [Pistacia integerrima]|uniref:Uncharacterized protein n=1 Tax=Pistacia integerrima TaxID=434235 RepID=A0ACC0XFY5_9ROSI|nr:hypothetical protein Pint_10273 [Pistacia integerrima]